MSDVLIIDDDMVSQYSARYSLYRYNRELKVLVYDGAEEALDDLGQRIILNQELPSLIFLDLVMDQINGWEFLDAFESMLSGYSGKLPEIYLLSSFEYSSDRERAKSHPMVSGHFNKPLNRFSLQKIFENNNPYQNRKRRNSSVRDLGY